MSCRDYLFLGLLGLLIVAGVAACEHVPGYMDADYYLATAKQISTGKGLWEPFLWNYLDNPSGLPHPSHTYWMPLASFLAALLPGIGLDGWWGARIPFLLLGACIPPLTASLAYMITSRRDLALASGLLAVLPGFYLPFLPTSDTFTIYILSGGLFLIIANKYLNSARQSFFLPLLLGIVSGIMHLSRTDGLLWLLMAILVVYLATRSHFIALKRVVEIVKGISFILLGYLVIMGPWFMRNMDAFGSMLAPGGMKMLWLTSYNQIFTFPATGISFANWLQSGFPAIFKARAWSLGMNLATSLAVQGEIILFPFVLLGMFQRRREKIISIAIVAWFFTLAIMTLLFPYAGARGGFFHSGAALQMLWWVMAPIGLEAAILKISKWRNWDEHHAQSTFRSGIIVLCAVITVVVLLLRLPGWGSEAAENSAIHQFLIQNNIPPEEVIIVSNPPGFYLASSRPSIVLPDGTSETVITLAKRYHASYLVLEPGSTTTGLQQIYDKPEDFPGFLFLGEVDGARIFTIAP